MVLAKARWQLGSACTNHQGRVDMSTTHVLQLSVLVSLFVGAAVGVLGISLACLVGMLAGYVGGWLDEVLGLVMNVFLVIPQLPLLIVASAYTKAAVFRRAPRPRR